MNKSDRSEMKLMLAKDDRVFIGQGISLEVMWTGKTKTQVRLRLPRSVNVEMDLAKWREECDGP